MTQILLIVSKDLRRWRWLLGVFYGLLLLAAGWNWRLAESSGLGGLEGPSSQLLRWVIAVAFLLLLVIVAHGDPPHRREALWLTRPLEGGRILAAKTVFVALCLLLPMVLAQLAALHLLGLPLTALAAAALASLGWVVPVALVAMLLAGLTPDLARFAVVSLGVGGALAALVALARWVFYLRWGSELGAHLLDSWIGLLRWMASITAIGLLAYQYRTRQRGPTAGVAALLALILVVSIVPWTGGLFWVGPDSHPPPSIRLAPVAGVPDPTPAIHQAPSPAAPLPADWSGLHRLELRVDVRQRPDTTYYRVLHAAFSLRYDGGRTLKPKTDSAGVVLGLDAALDEVLATASPAGGDHLRWPADHPAPPPLGLWVSSGDFDALAAAEAALKGRLVVEERRLRLLPALPLGIGAEQQRGTERLRLADLDRTGPFLILRLAQRRIQDLGASCDLWLLLEDTATGGTEILPPDAPSRYPREQSLPTPLARPGIVTGVSSPTFRLETPPAETSSPLPRNQSLSLLPIQDCPVGRRSALISERGFRMNEYTASLRTSDGTGSDEGGPELPAETSTPEPSSGGDR